MSVDGHLATSLAPVRLDASLEGLRRMMANRTAAETGVLLPGIGAFGARNVVVLAKTDSSCAEPGARPTIGYAPVGAGRESGPPELRCG